MEPKFTLAVDDIDLNDMGFWTLPWDEREGAFATLRRERPVAFFPEPEILDAPFPVPAGNGYYAITRHADISENSSVPPRAPPRSSTFLKRWSSTSLG